MNGEVEVSLHSFFPVPLLTDITTGREYGVCFFPLMILCIDM